MKIIVTDSFAKLSAQKIAGVSSFGNEENRIKIKEIIQQLKTEGYESIGVMPQFKNVWVEQWQKPNTGEMKYFIRGGIETIALLNDLNQVKQIIRGENNLLNDRR